MARTVTATAALAELRFRADVEGLTARHPDATLLGLFNRSWQSLRELVSESGGKHFLKTSTGALGLTESTRGPFVELDIPTDALRVYGISIDLGTYWIALENEPFSQHTSLQPPAAALSPRVPVAFFGWQHAQESGATTTLGKLGVWPVPTTAYPYVLWYLPQWADISGTSVLSEVSTDWFEWAIWDSVIKIAARDDDMRNTFAIAQAERARLTEAIKKTSSKMDRGQGVVRRQNVRDRRDYERAFINEPPWR